MGNKALLKGNFSLNKEEEKREVCTKLEKLKKRKEIKPKKGIMSVCMDTQEYIHMCLLEWELQMKSRL